MDNILVYITDNYISIIFFIVLILLAIIGYYAEKANNEKNKKISHEEQINIASKDALVNEQNSSIENLEINQKDNFIEKSELESESLNDVDNVSDSTDIQNDMIKEEKGNDLLPSEIPNIDINEENNEQINQGHETQNNEVIFNKEEINRFNEEFESILPKKEIIDSDLLSDIDDLELGKTQKIDLSEVPDLDNIDLPKIKQMDKEEDIWKF